MKPKQTCHVLVAMFILHFTLYTLHSFGAVVNGDTNVVYREIVTERDLLYVGGVWYEVPAENAGGFAALRPVALADEPVRELRGERGLMYLNGKPMVIDDLWKNGTATKAYWLWMDWLRRGKF